MYSISYKHLLVYQYVILASFIDEVLLQELESLDRNMVIAERRSQVMNQVSLPAYLFSTRSW